MSPNPIREQAVDTRVSQWTNAVEYELQGLITQAATIRKEISSAKTTAKKAYFQKKFKKLQPQVMQMVAALQQLQSTAPPDPQFVGGYESAPEGPEDATPTN